MDTQRSKRGLIIGAFVFAFLVFGVGVGMLVFSRTTDNRSQAAAAPVAVVRTAYQREVTGEFAHNVFVDISQMKAGTTVAEFSTRLFVATKAFLPPDQGTTTPRTVTVMPAPPTEYPKPSAMATQYPPRPVTVIPSGSERAATGMPVPATDYGKKVLGTATDVTPQNTILAQSKDGNLRVKGVGKYAQLQNLQVSVETTEDGYYIKFSAQAITKDSNLQLAFRQPEALIAIVGNEKVAALATPTVLQTSVRGYLPGLQTMVELTKQEVKEPTATPMPTDKPPLIVKACRSTKECPAGYTCQPPRNPTCVPGKACPRFFPTWQCTLTMPTPTVVRRPSVLPSKPQTVPLTENPRIIIKTIR